MGFCNLSVIMGIIHGGYQATFRISQLYARKIEIGRKGADLALRMGSRPGLRPPPVGGPGVAGGGDSNMPGLLIQPDDFKAKLLALNEEEAHIDQELEQLKAQGLALAGGIKPEYQKYVSDDIKVTFKNNYA